MLDYEPSQSLSCRRGSPHLNVNGDSDPKMTTQQERRSSVAFAENIDVYEVECFRPWWDAYWFQKEDYNGFAADRKACVQAYRKNSRNGFVSTFASSMSSLPDISVNKDVVSDDPDDDSGPCVHGLEGSLSAELREQTADRRAEIVEEVLTEQEEQWDEGFVDPDQLRLVSIRCSTQASFEAFERACGHKAGGSTSKENAMQSMHASCSALPSATNNFAAIHPALRPLSASVSPCSYMPSTYAPCQPPKAPHEFYGDGAGEANNSNPWAATSSSDPDNLVAPKRQVSKRGMTSNGSDSNNSLQSLLLREPKKEPSWRTTLTKQESLRQQSARNFRADTQPMMPKKQPSLKKDLDDSGNDITGKDLCCSPTKCAKDTVSPPKDGTPGRRRKSKDRTPKAVRRKPSRTLADFQ